MTGRTLDTLTFAIRVPLRLLIATLLLAGCATTTPEYAAERAYGTYWGYQVISPASGLRLIWVTPTQTACEVIRKLDQTVIPGYWASEGLRQLVGADGNKVEVDASCQRMELIPGTASMAVWYPPHEMTLAYERKGYLIAPSAETCARLRGVTPPCFPLTVRSGAASGR